MANQKNIQKIKKLKTVTLHKFSHYIKAKMLQIKF